MAAAFDVLDPAIRVCKLSSPKEEMKVAVLDRSLVAPLSDKLALVRGSRVRPHGKRGFRREVKPFRTSRRENESVDAVMMTTEVLLHLNLTL